MARIDKKRSVRFYRPYFSFWMQANRNIFSSRVCKFDNQLFVLTNFEKNIQLVFDCRTLTTSEQGRVQLPFLVPITNKSKYFFWLQPQRK